jgi:hypothetical protein
MCTPETLQLFFTGVLAVFTIVLACATISLALSTKKYTQETKKANAHNLFIFLKGYSERKAFDSFENIMNSSFSEFTDHCFEKKDIVDVNIEKFTRVANDKVDQLIASFKPLENTVESIGLEVEKDYKNLLKNIDSVDNFNIESRTACMQNAISIITHQFRKKKYLKDMVDQLHKLRKEFEKEQEREFRLSLVPEVLKIRFKLADCELQSNLIHADTIKEIHKFFRSSTYGSN